MVIISLKEYTHIYIIIIITNYTDNEINTVINIATASSI